MVAHRLLRQDEPFGDLGVGQPVGEQAKHLYLTRREPGRVGPARRPGAAGHRQALGVPGAQHRVVHG